MFAEPFRRLTDQIYEIREITVPEGSLGTDVRSPNPPVADLLFELAQNVSSLVVVGDEEPPRMGIM